MSSAKWRLFRLGLNVLRCRGMLQHVSGVVGCDRNQTFQYKLTQTSPNLSDMYKDILTLPILRAYSAFPGSNVAALPAIQCGS